MKKRLFCVLTLGAALLLGGCTYAWVCQKLGFGIPCVFHLITGLQCPGCGVSRMCLALLQLDFAGAWCANPAVLCLLPVLAAVGCDLACTYVRTGQKQPHLWANVLLWVCIAVLVIFGILRNLPI